MPELPTAWPSSSVNVDPAHLEQKTRSIMCCWNCRDVNGKVGNGQVTYRLDHKPEES